MVGMGQYLTEIKKNSVRIKKNLEQPGQIIFLKHPTTAFYDDVILQLYLRFA